MNATYYDNFQENGSKQQNQTGAAQPKEVAAPALSASRKSVPAVTEERQHMVAEAENWCVTTYWPRVQDRL